MVRLTASAALKAKRLASLLERGKTSESALADAVRAAQARGSLALAGRPVEEGLEAYGRAQRAVDPGAPFTPGLLRTWRRALTGGAEFRSEERTRAGGPAPAPPRFVEERLAILADWLNVESGRELKPAESGALVLARLMEILPFPDGNGLMARLAASHVMVRAGARPPILDESDGPRLDQALQAAFQLQTEPLVALLEEASERALDVMIDALEARHQG